MITETTTESWFSRIGSSITGILVGFILVVVSFGVLFWNEGRTIKQAKALTEGAQNVLSVDVANVDPGNEGKLIHVAGEATTNDVLNEDFFGVSLNALKLSRVVEAYQWKEESHTETERTSSGGSTTRTTYEYSKVWSSELIDSSGFKESGHDNPTGLPVASAEYYAPNASLGAFKLPERLIERLAIDAEKPYNPFEVQKQKETPVPTNEEKPTEAPQDSSAYTRSFRQHERYGAAMLDDYDEYAPNSKSEDEKETSQNVNGFIPYQSGYYKGDPNFAQIGDVRVTFTYVPTPCEVSVVSEQLGATFTPYRAKTGEVELVAGGLVSADKMFADAQEANKLFAWLLRALGVFLMFCGFNAFFRPLVVLSDVVPFMANIVGFGTGLLSFCLTVGFSSLTIAIGWLAYRPLIGVPLLILAIAAIVAPFVMKKKKRV